MQHSAILDADQNHQTRRERRRSAVDRDPERDLRPVGHVNFKHGHVTLYLYQPVFFLIYFNFAINHFFIHFINFLTPEKRRRAYEAGRLVQERT